MVNTHDEYLPVPAGYSKEEWVDKIADFMLNRWGTWVHTGGYPLYRVWHENGTVEEWCEIGFQQLMGHIGKENITCHPPETNDRASLNIDLFPNMWRLYGYALDCFTDAHLGCPITLDDLKGDLANTVIYKYKGYLPAVAVFFRTNLTESFGVYIHSSPWEFYGSGVTWSRNNKDTFMGCVSTAAAIWADMGEAIERIYGRGFGEGAVYAIEKAKRDGRTVDLSVAEDYLLNALDAFNANKYKLVILYAEKAKTAAEKAATPNYILPAMTATSVTVASMCIGAHYYKKNKKNSDVIKECADSKQC